jgi:murein DD-endopeptidase MepM/ murein hydrolase activator NlpD
LAAEYATERASHRVVYFVGNDRKGGYYTPEGRSIRRAFLKTPLSYRRISSRFDRKRLHPILHRTKGHFGVDYAAPTGTSIWAAADGKVLKIGRFGGAGRMVLLQHASGVRTVYMHMHRFAKGLHRGSRVKQRQYIGQVGATGLATGPHLHYGIYVYGRPIDPQEFEIGKGPLLPPEDHARFSAELPLKLAALKTVAVPGGDRRLARHLLGPVGDDWLP